uniref:Uncharacterized protein n=1 Tax=Lepeophtheirus salmonis TaxID=72036 RepID=A0A0K2U0F8_LEPSM
MIPIFRHLPLIGNLSRV